MNKTKFGKCPDCGKLLDTDLMGACRCDKCQCAFVVEYSPAIRGFEKVSFAQFLYSMQNLYGEEIDVHAVNVFYNAIKTPQRATTRSAGYDFFSPISFYLPPGKTIKIPSGIKSYMQDDEVLSLYVRSSTGFKYAVNLLNNVGKVDCDFFNNADNEGHISFGFINHGDKEWVVHAGDAFGQGIFEKYLVADCDSPKTKHRTGGLGSTSR